MAGWPVINDDERDEMLGIEKWVDEDCAARLFRTSKERNARRGRYYLPDAIEVGPHKGQLFLFSRFNLDAAVARWDFTVGLGLRDPYGREYRLIRCNGPHGPHTNRLEGVTLPPVPHVHLMTERYQKGMAMRPEWRGDGYAEACDTYSDRNGALRHLASVANIQAEGMMFLV